MDMKQLLTKLGIPDNVKLLRKSQELQRLSNVHFNSSAFGVVSDGVLLLMAAGEDVLALAPLQVPFSRQRAIRCSGLSEKAYLRSAHAIQNALGLRKRVDIRELAVQFGCVRLIDIVQKALALYKQRFVAALPETRRASADFNRPVFASVAFYLCAKKHKLKVDKTKLMELCGTSESEFSNVAISMTNLCFDVLGIRKEKRDSKSIKGNRDLLDALPDKRKRSDDETSSDDGEYSDEDDEDKAEIPGFKRSNRSLAKKSYNDWKKSVISSSEAIKLAGALKEQPAKRRQTHLNFIKVVTSAELVPLP